MNIKWAALGDVLGIGLAVGIGVAVLFSFALVGFSRVATARENGGKAGGGAAVTGGGIAACGAIARYGLYLIAQRSELPAEPPPRGNAQKKERPGRGRQQNGRGHV